MLVYFEYLDVEFEWESSFAKLKGSKPSFAKASKGKPSFA